MPFLSRLLKSRDGTKTPTKSRSRNRSSQNGAVPLPPPKPRWEDAWLRKNVEPEEVQELLRGCTEEMKSRALDVPFLLLPYRPTSDPSAGRTFIRNFFSADRERLRGQRLEQELRLTEPTVICSVMKWCWSRLAGGVVTREAYELFRIGEQDSSMARDAFATFIPISVESDARTKIIFDFFDLMAAIAAHGKSNGMGGRKLSRLGGWWAFEHSDTGSGFDGGYQSWQSAADATSHLFFAYLRSLSPGSIRGVNGVSVLPRSLQSLVEATEYPPDRLLQPRASKVVMTVDSVSPTPFALLRRAKHFQYRDDDFILQEFSDYDDPVQALTDECQRVLRSISSTNQSSNSMASTSLPDASWSRFEDIGFTSLGGDSDNDDEIESALGRKRQQPQQHRLRSTPQSKAHELGRPSTPSWADFLSSGFVDEPAQGPAPLLLRPDQMLPPIKTSHNKGPRTPGDTNGDRSDLEPGELASIITVNLDDAFWWVWICSLASEESTERKAAFGRCALIETKIQGGSWLIMEEMVQGAAPEPEVGAYIAEKKSRFGFSTRNRLNRSKSIKNKPLPPPKAELQSRNKKTSPISKATIDPVQHARIQAAASALQQRQRQLEIQSTSPRRARHQEVGSTKTNSVFTLQPVIMSEAAPAMKWANSYDKEVIRAAYLGSNFAGKGSNNPDVEGPNVASTNGSTTPMPHNTSSRQDSYGFPSVGSEQVREKSLTPEKGMQAERDLPALPRKDNEEFAPATPPKMYLPPSAALHNTLPEDTRVDNKIIAEAAEVPLPSPTPMEQPRPVERKPLPPINQRGATDLPLPTPTPKEDPDAMKATYDPSVDRRPLPPMVRKESAPLPPPFAPQVNGTVYTSVFTTSPPENLDQGKVLKRDNPNAFKGFFSKKKIVQPSRPTPTKPATDSAAVAAARAAYSGPDQYSAARPTQHTTLTRRFSNMRRTKSPHISPAATPSVPTVRDDEVIHAEPAGTATQYDTPPASPRFEHLPTPPRFEHTRGFNESQASINRVDSTEERHAEHEFQSFDQGPLADQPAFVPDDIPEESEESLASAEPSMHRNTQYEPSDTVSEASIEFPQSPAYPAQDRWAQIRRNAAERAAKQSEELSRQSTIDEHAIQRTREGQSRKSLAERTEDGETSGEETIESRVARIRARVVELTSNMDHRVPGHR